MASLAPATQQRAAIYCRVSTQEQGEHGYSLEAQLGDCRKLAAELGAAVAAEYQDVDSGAAWDLPGLNALLDAAKRREFDLVLAYDPDRLARRMAKQLVLEEELARCDVALRYVTFRMGDSAEDRLLKNVKSSIAEYEREKIALRTSRGRRAKAERGLVVGTGPAPFGYAYVRDTEGRIFGLDHDPRTAPIARRIFADAAAMAINKVCTRLNDEGIPTPYGAKRGWTNATLLHLLSNPVYLGRAAYGRTDAAGRARDASQWITSQAPPLVDRATWDAAHRGLQRRKLERPARKPADTYALRGLLTCGHCGGAISCVSGGFGIRYYACLRHEPGRARTQGHALCPLPPLVAEGVSGVEADAWERVAAALLDPARLERGFAAARADHAAAQERAHSRIGTLAREIDKQRARLARVLGERVDAEPGSESERALRALGAEIDDQIARLRADLVELEAQPLPGLSEEQAIALEEFAAEVRAGIGNAGPAERRRAYGLLQLRGRARLDPEHGLPFNAREPIRIEWEALIAMPNSSKGFLNLRLRLVSEQGVPPAVTALAV